MVAVVRSTSAGSFSTGASACLLFFGLVFFLAIIAGLILNTIFLVREIRRNERHDSFINAVTHELKTPITSIRLYLETLQRREVDQAQRQQFYKLMLEDSDRLLGTVEQVLKAGEAGYKRGRPQTTEVDFGGSGSRMRGTRPHAAPPAAHRLAMGWTEQRHARKCAGRPRRRSHGRVQYSR